MRRATLLCWTLLAACSATTALGFERTEKRAPCADHNPLRNVYFGDTHVHTSFSFDASALGVRTTPAHDIRPRCGDRCRCARM